VLQAVIGSEKRQASKAHNSGTNGGHIVIEQNDFELDIGGLGLQDLVLQSFSEDEEVPVLRPQTIEECTYCHTQIFRVAYMNHRWA